MPERVYEAWRGNNVFLFHGRWILGSNVRILPVTLLLILLPVVIFCVFVAVHLQHEFSPYYAGYAFLVVPIVLALLVSASFLRVSIGDPGILPRNPNPPDGESSHGSIVDNVGHRRRRRKRIRVMVDGTVAEFKYCETCMIYRPPRASHCSVCNNCVERFDHHCPWLGQCIGLRNYRHYFCFIASTALLCGYICGVSAFNIKVLVDHNHRIAGRALKEFLASVCLTVYCFFGVLFLGALTAFHLYLIATNQTTSENYKSQERRNPHDQGCSRNFYEVFCTKVKPSEHQFRAFVPERREPPVASADDRVVGVESHFIGEDTGRSRSCGRSNRHSNDASQV